MTAHKFLTYLAQCLLLGACLLLMLLGSQRSFDVAGHNPLYGYANSYDMVRLQGCHQIWPQNPSVHPLKGYTKAPLEHYQAAQHTTLCFPSSELLFTQLALSTNASWIHHQKLHLSHIGKTKATVLLAVALFCGGLLLLHRQWLALLANSLIYCAVLSDIGISLFFNTFYTEFSAVLFSYLCLWGSYLLFVPSAFSHGRALTIIGLAGLAMSKAQHLPLASCLAVGLPLLLLAGGYQLKRVWLIAALPLAAAALAALYHPSTASEQVKSVNRSNALYGLASNQPELVTQFLPQQCAQFAGGSWYHTQPDFKDVCTVTGSGHVAILLSALHQPQAVLRYYWQNIGQIKAWQYNYLGQVANAEQQAITPPRYSAMNALHQMSKTQYTWLWIGCLLLALTAWRSPPWRALLLSCAFIQFSSYFIALTGDGFSELAKHAHLSVTAQLILLICATVFILGKLGHTLWHRLWPRQLTQIESA